MYIHITYFMVYLLSVVVVGYVAVVVVIVTNFSLTGLFSLFFCICVVSFLYSGVHIRTATKPVVTFKCNINIC